jgi:hypothetical protein
MGVAAKQLARNLDEEIMELQRGRHFTNIVTLRLFGKGKSCPGWRIDKQDMCHLQMSMVRKD